MFREQATMWWLRTRWARYAFVGGLLLGLTLGWAFYGLVSLVIRFFFVLIFLMPLVVVLWFWWRSTSQSNQSRPPSEGPTVVTWGYPDDPLRGPNRQRPPVDADPFEDPYLDDTIPPRRRARPPDQTSGTETIQEADWRER